MSTGKKICMITVQHSAKDDRIYFKQAMSLQKAGYKVSIVHGTTDGTLKDMSGIPIPEGPDAFGIVHLAVKEPESLLDRLCKKMFLGSFYSDFIAKATGTGAHIYVAHEAQSIYIARKCAEKVQGTYVFDAHESLHLVSPKAKYAIRVEMPRIPYLTAANSITQKAIHAFNAKVNSEVIYNASPIISRDIEDHSSLLIVHEGSLPFNRGLKLMMEALVVLKAKIPEFRFRIVGEVKGEEKRYFDTMCEKHGLRSNIEVTGWQPYERLADHLESAAIGLILNTPTPNNLNAGPANKLFNYMACNICVVAVDLPETTRILSETGAGLTLKDRTPQTLADTLEELHTNKGLLGKYRTAAHEAHIQRSWEKEAEKLISFYKKTN